MKYLLKFKCYKLKSNQILINDELNCINRLFIINNNKIKMCSPLVFTVIVICLNVYLCAGRPYADGNIQTLPDNSLEDINAESKQFEYKLPTKLNGDWIITIKGTNINTAMFTVKLLSKSQDSYCELNYSIDKEELEINSNSPEHRTRGNYNMALQGQDAIIEMSLQPRNYGDGPIINFGFNGNNSGPSDSLICEVNGFEDFDRIVIKGIQNVTSLKFKFVSLK